MKSKRIMIGCMSLVICLLALTACSVAGTGSQNDDRSTADEKYHTLYYKDITKRENVTAVFSSCNSQQTEEVRMEAVGKDEDGFTYSCKGDASSYHLVSFRYDQFSTAKVAFNPCVSGWYNSVHGILPYTYGCTDQYESHTANLVTMNDTLVYDNEMYDDVNLPFNGYDKIVHIWTPADYDPSSDEKYTTVYLLDGQGMIYLGFPGETNDEFEESRSFCERMRFTHIHTFRYSKRPGTRAAEMEGQVPPAVSAARSDAIRELGERLRKRCADKLRRAAAGRPWMAVSDVELRAESQPRTYDTLCRLRDEGYEPSLLLGSDKLPELEHGWLHVEDIAREFGFVCMTRGQDACREMIASDPYLAGLSSYILVVETPETLRGVSSTAVRRKLSRLRALRREVAGLVPEEILEML